MHAPSFSLTLSLSNSFSDVRDESATSLFFSLFHSLALYRSLFLFPIPESILGARCDRRLYGAVSWRTIARAKDSRNHVALRPGGHPTARPASSEMSYLKEGRRSAGVSWTHTYTHTRRRTQQATDSRHTFIRTGAPRVLAFARPRARNYI